MRWEEHIHRLLGPVTFGSTIHAQPAARGTRVAAVSPAKPVRNNRAADVETQAAILELSKIDREVRAHEQAHLAAAGGHARGGPTYTYQRGPDGQLYAVGGEVSIDTSAIPGDPEATLRKAEVIRSAALAPAEPSSQDRAVAAQASQLAASAQAEIQQRRLQSAYGGGEESSASLLHFG